LTDPLIKICPGRFDTAGISQHHPLELFKLFLIFQRQNKGIRHPMLSFQHDRKTQITLSSRQQRHE